jgi:branched-chain amino acid transport system permease protein
MSPTILLFLAQDGVMNGAVYALLGVTLVLMFTVTRVIFVAQGEFVAWGALTMAALENGAPPGTAKLLVGFGLAAAAVDLLRSRGRLPARRILLIGARDVAFPILLLALISALAPLKLGMAVDIALTLAVIAPMGPLVYRLAFQPLADASVLILFIAAIGVHLAMTGLGLAVFGAEGSRLDPMLSGVVPVGPIVVKMQSLAVLANTAAVMGGLFFFFERTLLGKALRATAVNRLGARLVGVRVDMTARTAFALAAGIGAISGVLIGPLTTVAYDTGFLIGLKGFVAAIIAGLASYPMTALAALAIGLIESYSAFFASAFKEAIVFAIIIPFLLWRSYVAGAPADEEEE